MNIELKKDGAEEVIMGVEPLEVMPPAPQSDEAQVS